ncbi:MAG: transposase [Ignavibacteriales bacterium]|nr:transposase [Ignavibacteriales bacterium]
MRPKHFSIENGIFFLTVRCAHGMKPFLIDIACETYLIVLQEKLRDFNSTLFAYVLMPDHMHLLLQLPEKVSLNKLMNHINGTSARKVNNVLGSTGVKFWQGGFHDVYVRRPKDFAIKVNYIHNNPVKAEIVQRPEDHAFSSAKFYKKKFGTAIFQAGEFNQFSLDGITSEVQDIWQ